MAPAKSAKEPKYITEAQLDEKLSSFLDKVVAVVGEKKADVKETPEEVEVKKAGPNAVMQNPEWDEKAKEILGEYLDHSEFTYMKNGGVLFTVVIKKEKSNAAPDYLVRMGQDRRSKDVGQEGTAGVEAWCALVKRNLVRPK